MAVSFQIPFDLEQNLRRSVTDLDAQAKEALLVALYRQGKLSHVALSRALGLDRFETEQALHRHNVTEDLGTVQDYLDDVATLEKLRASR
jgi:hypothetical protein